MQLLQLKAQDCATPVVCSAVTSDNSDREVECVDIKEFTCNLSPYASYVDKVGVRYAAPDGALISAIQEAANEFSRETHILQRRFKMRTQMGVSDYFIEPLPGEQVHLIQSVCVGARVLRPLGGVEPCGDPYRLWADRGTGRFSCCSKGQWMCEYFMFMAPDKLVLRTAPGTVDDCKDITVNYIATTDFTACNFDRLLYTRHRTAIIKGAAEQLLTLPGWEWSNPGYGVKTGKNFASYIADARVDMAKSYSTASQSAITMDRF